MKKINDIDCDLFFENKEKLNDIFEFLKDSVYEGDDDIEAETADFLTKCLKTKFDKIPDTSKAKFWSFSPFDQKVTICIANDTEPCGYEKNIDFFKAFAKKSTKSFLSVLRNCIS